MKKHALFTLLFALTLCLAANAQTQVFHIRGAYAQSNFQNTSLFIGTGDVGLGGLPFLDYSTFVPHPDGSYDYGYGFGTIPASAFDAHNTQQVSLNIDTSQVAGFQAQTCHVVFQPSYTSTCTAGPYGMISLNWVNNGYSSSTTRQTLNYSNGAEKHNTSSNGTYSSANGSGTFFGTNVVDDASKIGNDQNREIDITPGP